MPVTDQTPLLSLPYIQAAQAQKHVTHNEAIERLDMLVQLTLEAVDAITPPASAAEGQAWSVGAGGTGAWSSQGGTIAAWRGGGWLFVTPQLGWRAWDKTNAVVVAYDGTGWTQASAAAPDLENLSGVGVNATSDATNRLAVASDATLLTHDGSGHQLKINKAASADTASLLYQSNWSGRAEMGLAGNDDFSVKVSDDGVVFTEALRIDGSTGTITMPSTGQRQMTAFNYRYYLYTDKRWVAPSANPASLLATQSLGVGTEPNIDWDGKGIFLPANSIIESFTLAGNPSNPEINDLDLRMYFQHGPWNTSWGSASEATRDTLFNLDSAGVIGSGGMRRTKYMFNYTTPADGYFSVAMRQDNASAPTATHSFYAAGILVFTSPTTG